MWLRVPPKLPAQATAETGLLVMLHGSGGEPEQGLALLEPFAAAAGLHLLAPASASYTWDTVLGRWGPDHSAILDAVAWSLACSAADPRRVWVGGFSDGASAALALGLSHPRQFSKIVALSPGFIPRAVPRGEPPVFVSHGRGDTVLPLARCSRVIVPRLRAAGHEVDYREFDGGHEVPPAIAQAAVQWLLAAES